MRPIASFVLAVMLATSLGTAVAGLFIPRGAEGALNGPDTCGCSFARYDVVALLGGGKALIVDHATGKLTLGDLPALPLPPAPKPAPKESF